MPNAPHIEITGNLTRDPEMRFTPNGIAVCKITVAVTPRKRDSATGNWSDGDPQFWDVTAWRQLAENVSESLMRGDPVTVIGTVDFREWLTKPTDERDSEKRHQHEITADVISVPLTFHTVRVKRSNRNTSKPAVTNRAGSDDANADGMTEFADTGK